MIFVYFLRNEAGPSSSGGPELPSTTAQTTKGKSRVAHKPTNVAAIKPIVTPDPRSKVQLKIFALCLFFVKHILQNFCDCERNFKWPFICSNGRFTTVSFYLCLDKILMRHPSFSLGNFFFNTSLYLADLYC